MSGADSASSSRFLRNRVGVKKYFFKKRVKKSPFLGKFRFASITSLFLEMEKHYTQLLINFSLVFPQHTACNRLVLHFKNIISKKWLKINL